MAVKMFASIDVGSYEVGMKIFEFPARHEMKEIDCVRYRMELGKDTFNTGKISVKKIEELCSVLKDFVRIMNGYKVTSYRACATRSVREAENRMLVLEQGHIADIGSPVELLRNHRSALLEDYLK